VTDCVHHRLASSDWQARNSPNAAGLAAGNKALRKIIVRSELAIVSPEKPQQLVCSYPLMSGVAACMQVISLAEDQADWCISTRSTRNHRRFSAWSLRHRGGWRCAVSSSTSSACFGLCPPFGSPRESCHCCWSWWQRADNRSRRREWDLEISARTQSF